MTPQTLLFASSSLFILSLHFFQTCLANCIPSACGDIRNISYPFRLKNDSKHCGDFRFELACENNVAFLILNSHKYYVKDINYDNSTIRLADASISNLDTCSFPKYSAYRDYQSGVYNLSSLFKDVAQPINFMQCPHPLKNSSLFTDITRCKTSDSNSSHPGFRYVKVGHMKASEVPQSCGIEVIVMTSREFRDLNNVSLLEIHDSLLYGFQLTYCTTCVLLTKKEKVTAYMIGFLYFALIVLGLLCGGVSPVFTIIGFTGILLLLRGTIQLSSIMPYGQLSQTAENFVIALSAGVVLFFLLIAVVFILAAKIIISPVALCFLIYTFRRRHLSMYNTIETFLQSDNKLMPIRYSYSQIKKMTRAFRDKLGEGGYGSVYKGKLRSGHDVAVKLLGKSDKSGKDFMNEIATIGRVHHVNIVKLVGYCAQGSTRALIFDFMSNGSLEKYLFNRDNTKSLNLHTKFEIAVGVARGIEYLHRGCDVQILHFDIKPHNILLDDKFIPKISDFGLAKLCSTDKTTVTITAARGTIGYVAPELISRSIGAVSHKADVYSFGMLLMEMVSLNRDLIGNNGDSEQYFPYWIYNCLNQGKDIEIEDANENNDSMIKGVGRKMTIVALWCIQMNPDSRPSMSKVLEMLEGDVERLEIPNHHSESYHVAVNMEESGSGTTHYTDAVTSLSHGDGPCCFEISVEE